MLERNKKIFILIASLVVLNFFVYRYDYDIFSKNYPTIKEAFENNNQFKDGEIINIIIDNDVALVFFNDNKNGRWEYLYKENDKWKFISRQIEEAKVFINKEEYLISYRVYKGKNIITIADKKFISEEVNRPKDSIGSNYKYFNVSFDVAFKGEAFNFEFHDWFLVLDEVPENYQLYINEEKIKIN